MESVDRKIFGTLFFSIFAAVTGVGVVVPLLPIYAHDLGASGLYIGLIYSQLASAIVENLKIWHLCFKHVPNSRKLART